MVHVFTVLYKTPEICFTDTTYRVNVCTRTVILCHIPSQTTIIATKAGHLLWNSSIGSEHSPELFITISSASLGELQG